MIESRIEIIRARDSFKFDSRRLLPVYLDTFRLYEGTALIFESRCQSVAIHPRCTWAESIAPGSFKTRLFAEKREYAHPVHELIDAFDLEGERIDNRAMQIDAQAGVQGRWLIHDDWNPTTRAAYRAPWSAGCIIVPHGPYEEFNALLRGLGHKTGDIVPVTLRQVEG